MTSAISVKDMILAFQFIDPLAEFTINGDDIENFDWKSEKSKPTLDEIATVIPLAKSAAKKTEETNIQKRQELLARLGVTEQELILLLG